MTEPQGTHSPPETPTLLLEESLRQHIQRLQILHDIDLAILSAQDEQATAAVALKHIHELVPGYRASSVLLINMQSGEAHVLASDSVRGRLAWKKNERLSLQAEGLDVQALEQGLPVVSDELQPKNASQALHKRMEKAGAAACLALPLRYGGELIGVLILASAQSRAFGNDSIQIMQEVADSLAVAMQQSRLLKAEQSRRQEAEVMRDILSALAGAANLKQALEIILINLHTVIEYDRAGLFLADENGYVLARKAADEGESSDIHLQDTPLVLEMQHTKRPVVVYDVKRDARFAGWPDMESVHGWLGAPLIVDEKLIGFLALGSLKAGAYKQADADTMHVFASKVAEVVEKAWLYEQTTRRTEELEVLSDFTFALEQAESRENTLYAITDQVTHFLGAQRGAFLSPDKTEKHLVVRFSLDEAANEMQHPRGSDPLWQVFSSGQPQAITNAQEVFYQRKLSAVYKALCGTARSTVLIPLKASGTTFGILFIAFEQRRNFSLEDIRLYNAVAEIAGSSLRRTVVLQALEEQVNIRTQHLTTLYNINTIASESLGLPEILERVLQITLEALKSPSGAIHFQDERGEALYLFIQHNLPPDLQAALERLSLSETFGSKLVNSFDPLIIPDLRSDSSAPSSLRGANLDGKQAVIAAPIRAQGRSLGLLSIFGSTILNYSIEDITLFMTIADQIGSLVERARLVDQAGQAAVVEERQRLARELHDSVTQLLYSQVLFAGASLKVLRQNNLQLTEQHLMRIDQAAQQALKEMRLLVYELRPSDQLDDGLVEALQRRLNAVEKRSSINAQLLVEGHITLDDAQEVALYRTIQEALNNTLKHAAASNVTIHLAAANGRTRVEIVDDGQGFEMKDRARSGGIGLSSMRERVAALGGQMEIITRPGEGTRVIITLED